MRYYFNFRNSLQYFRDPEGDELPDLAAAREEGRLSARQLMSLDHGEPDTAFDGAIFEICDALGTVLAVTHFQEALLEAAAAR
jgi:hypothetical protein